METQTRLSRHNKFISAENIVGIFSVSSDDSFTCSVLSQIVIHRQICFVLSELISVARQYLPVAGIETRLTQTPSQASNHLATRRY